MEGITSPCEDQGISTEHQILKGSGTSASNTRALGNKLGSKRSPSRRGPGITT